MIEEYRFEVPVNILVNIGQVCWKVDLETISSKACPPLASCESHRLWPNTRGGGVAVGEKEGGGLGRCAISVKLQLTGGGTEVA